MKNIELFCKSTKMLPFTASSFNLIIPHPNPQSDEDKLLTPLTDFLDPFFIFKFDNVSII